MRPPRPSRWPSCSSGSRYSAWPTWSATSARPGSGSARPPRAPTSTSTPRPTSPAATPPTAAPPRPPPPPPHPPPPLLLRPLLLAGQRRGLPGPAEGQPLCMNDGPLIVQSDKTLLLEVDHERASDCRKAIAPFAELERSPEHI